MKEIPGYEGLYACDKEGNVYSLDRIVPRVNGKGVFTNRKGKKLLQSNRKGYLSVSLSKDGKRLTKNIHRLMGITFLTVPENMTINHKDGNKKNNNLNNLEVCTTRENTKHACQLGLMPRGSNHHEYFITPEMREKVRTLLSITNLTQKEIGKIVGISQSQVSVIKLNQFPHREL